MKSKLTRFDAALPFTLGERAWLLAGYGGLTPGQDILSVMRDSRARIIDAGIERDVDGEALVRRWVLWRRGLDEFADASTALVAQRLLNLLAMQLSAGRTGVVTASVVVDSES